MLGNFNFFDWVKFQGFMQFGYGKLGSTFEALLMILHFSDLHEIVQNYL
jgi:hypothetical protein